HVTSRVRPQPCREKNDSVTANFQAPEVFSTKDGSGGKNGCKENVAGSNTSEHGNSAENGCAEARDSDRGTYDPIVADVFSFGATFFFANTRNYPAWYSKTADSDLGPAIQKSINYAKNLSAEATQWFSGLLKPDPAQRTTF